VAVKARIAASSTFVSVLLTLSTYGDHPGAALQPMIGLTGEAQAPAAPVSFGDPQALPPAYRIVDPAMGLAQAEGPQSPSRLTLAVPDGETLAGVLAIADVTPGDAQEAIDAARGVYDPRKLRAGQFVTVNFRSDGGAFQGFEIQTDNEHVLAVRRDGAAFHATQTALPVKTEIRAAHGVIRTSLFESAAQAGIPYAVTAAIIRAFSYDVDFQRDIQPGDRFKVMFNATVAEEASWPGDVLYAELDLSGKTHAIYGVKGDGGAVEFFTRDGKSIKKSLLRTPVDGARLTSSFGMRLHPILGYTRMHKGVDFGAPTGAPIYAAGDGVVEVSGWAGGYGRFVKIRHNPHNETAYGHMSRIAAGAAAGAHVRQGEIIGYVGMTGDATGPHLHYEVLKDGAQVNPTTVTGLPTSIALDGPRLTAFLKTVDEREQKFAQLTDGARVAVAPPQ
jgi:murein DD-endopeptidase MepM/ murein hydrolase activator NlpD